MFTRSVFERDRLRLLTRVARLYHEQGVRQPEIARHLHLSRARVSRLLKEAGERGIVRTLVVPPAGVHSALEEELAARFKLVDVVVVDVEGSGPEVSAALGTGAAAYLDATLIGGDVIGVPSWSSTLLATVEALPPKRTRVAERVVQVVGGLGSPEAQLQANRLTGRLADITGAKPVFVPSHGLVGSPGLRHAVMRNPRVVEVRQQWSSLTLALVGIGTQQPSALVRRSAGGLTLEEQTELARLGAVGDVCLRYFDRHGRRVESSLDRRVIGIDAADLRRVPRRVAVAGGAEKAEAILGAVRGRWINILVTDLGVARLLTQAESVPDPLG